jgi:hypothetical protein
VAARGGDTARALAAAVDPGDERGGIAARLVAQQVDDRGALAALGAEQLRDHEAHEEEGEDGDDNEDEARGTGQRAAA